MDRPSVYIPKSVTTYKVKTLRGVLCGTIHESYKGEDQQSIKDRALKMYDIDKCNLEKMRNYS